MEKVKERLSAKTPQKGENEMMDSYQERYLQQAKKDIPVIIQMMDDEVERRESPYADGLRIRLGQAIVLLKHFGGDSEWN